MNRIPPPVARRLGHYVYLYVDPRDGEVFYIGKGKGSRALAHLGDRAQPEVRRRIRSIRAAGEEPQIEILTHGLPSERVALQVEAAAIDLLRIDNLLNAVRGWHSRNFGRMRVEDLVAHYTEREVEIRDPSILVRINRSYKYGMTPIELYDATRSAWKVGPRKEEARYAFAVYKSIIREAYEITDWMPGGKTFNSRTGARPTSRSGRWEFVGVVADDRIRKRYVNKSVARHFKQGNMSPVVYVGFD